MGITLEHLQSERPVIEDTSITALRAAETFIESNTDESFFDTTVEANGIYGQTDDEPEDLFYHRLERYEFSNS